MREHRIHSLGELIDAVTPAEPDPEVGRRRDSGVYHGAPSASFPLLTSLDRLGGTDPPHTKAHLEEHILRNFARYSRPHLPSAPATDWELLVIAQHYGVPTRLLDWSYSPLVAAHFATRKAPRDGDCAIWRLEWHQVHRAFALPNLALQTQDLLTPRLFGSEHALSPWDLFAGRGPSFACLLEPPSLEERIAAQGAVFTLCSDTSRPFDAFLREHGLEDALTRFVVPADSVARLRDQLDLAGIEERRLFPGLEGVAASIRRYYT